MKWPLFLLVLWTTTFSGDAASNLLVSSVEEDGRESACPGEVVLYTCTVVDGSDPLIGTTLWRGSAFDCTPSSDIITLQHTQFVNGTSGTCGDLTAQSEGQDGTCFTSVLTLPEADEGMSGKTIECTLSGAVTVGSDTVAVASCPAPTITITELTPESVRVSIDGYPEDTLLCSYTLMGNVMNESGHIVQTFSAVNETSVNIVLDLCSNVYTFEVSVMCGNVISDTTTMEFNSTLISLNCSTDLMCDGGCDENPQTLSWDAPTNLPSECNVAYEIEVDGVLRNTTTDTSVSVTDLGLSRCDGYTAKVTPTLTDRIGPLTRCSSEVVVPGFPSPTITRVDFVYRQQDIRVTVTWELGEGDVSQVDDVTVECKVGGMDVCTPVNLTDITDTMYTVVLDYSDVIGSDVTFSVTFVNARCQRSDTDPTRFPNPLVSATATNVDRTVADIEVVYNDVDTDGNLLLFADVSAPGDRELMSQVFPPIPTPAFRFTGLIENTSYMLEVSVENGLGVTIGTPVTNVFTTTPTPTTPPSGTGATSTTLSTGAAVAIATCVTFIVAVTIGCLSGALLYHVLTKLRARSSNHYPESSGGGGQQPTAPLYEDVSPPPPAGEKIELRENVAYGPVQH